MGSLPSLIREWAAAMVGACAVSLVPFLNVASAELSSTSGSNVANAEIAVLSTSIG